MIEWDRIRTWEGWRRYSPAAGSVGAHFVIGAAIAGLIAASTKAEPALPRMLEITLLAETPPPPREVAAPVPRPKAPPVRPDPKAEAPPEKPRAPARRQEATAAPATGATLPSDGGVYLGPSPLLPGPPAGLAGLLETDPCKKAGLKLKDCNGSLHRFAQADAWQSPTAKELDRYYDAFIPDCEWKVGCDRKEWISTNGTRSFGGKSPMASGAGGLQGIHDLVGRLPQKPDFVDPGFGD